MSLEQKIDEILRLLEKISSDLGETEDGSPLSNVIEAQSDVVLQVHDMISASQKKQEE